MESDLHRSRRDVRGYLFPDGHPWNPSYCEAKGEQKKKVTGLTANQVYGDLNAALQQRDQLEQMIETFLQEVKSGHKLKHQGAAINKLRQAYEDYSI